MCLMQCQSITRFSSSIIKRYSTNGSVGKTAQEPENGVSEAQIPLSTPSCASSRTTRRLPVSVGGPRTDLVFGSPFPRVVYTVLSTRVQSPVASSGGGADVEEEREGKAAAGTAEEKKEETVASEQKKMSGVESVVRRFANSTLMVGLGSVVIVSEVGSYVGPAVWDALVVAQNWLGTEEALESGRALVKAGTETKDELERMLVQALENQEQIFKSQEQILESQEQILESQERLIKEMKELKGGSMWPKLW